MSNPLPMPKEVPLLHDLVNDYLRYKTNGFPETANRVLALLKQTIDDIIEHPENFIVMPLSIEIKAEVSGSELKSRIIDGMPERVRVDTSRAE
ncbi:hypothetical protein [Spirosoma endbachense]|uniref:Uncharacterized protein n=1 Tax=Spirosoma endbachense TaxID=2666025 RepID=A0A6P1W5B0_9BACT|nr:hypothetical protein [Spirosoma endbachense]QHV99209.1 hypothetical protein GJR95_31220 [Spirosoma endbachense]